MFGGSNFYFFKGRVALYALLKAIGVKEGDEVILPGFTCVVVPNAIVYLGARPVYVDIDPRTFNIDPTKIEEKITKNTKVIIAQHTFGIPAEMDGILAIAKKYGLFVIEDSCHAIGSKYKGKEVGSLGDASFFSSQWSKPVTTGLGGWAVVNNPELRENMEKIHGEFTEPGSKKVALLKAQYLLYSKFLTPGLFWLAMNTYRRLSSLGITVGSSDDSELEGEMPEDYASKMSDWQIELLKKKMSKIMDLIEHRKKIASLYEELLPQIGFDLVKLPDYMEVVYLRYPVLVKNKWEILERAKKKRIEIGDWFLSPVHPNLNSWDKVFYNKGMCPIGEDNCNRIINLPTHEKISEREVYRIIDFLSKEHIL